MAQSYLERGLRCEARFAVWVRRLPTHWGHLIAAGAPRILELAPHLRFTPDNLRYQSLETFAPNALQLPTLAATQSARCLEAARRSAASAARLRRRSRNRP